MNPKKNDESEMGEIDTSIQEQVLGYEAEMEKLIDEFNRRIRLKETEKRKSSYLEYDIRVEEEDEK